MVKTFKAKITDKRLRKLGRTDLRLSVSEVKSGLRRKGMVLSLRKGKKAISKIRKKR